MPRLIALLLALLLPRAAAAQEGTASFGSGPTDLLLRSTTDIAIIRPVMARFAERNPDLTLRYEQWGSNALYALGRAACAGRAEPADALLSSGAHQMLALVNSACAHPYRSAATAALPDQRRWRDELWGITEEPAVIIYNTTALSPEDVPRTRFALLDLMRKKPELLRSRIATYDIEDSGLGYLFAHADSLEATTFGAMLEAFARIGAIATCCSLSIIDGVSEGRYYIAYNVLGSYAEARAAPNVGIILPEDYTLMMSRSFMIPKTARHPEAAQRLLDFLLSPEAQGMLADLGLIAPTDPAETSLLPSARRLIALSPPLLLALDRSTRERLFRLWDEAFSPDAG
ncbi:ABC transporter substrate-binding protein [Salipiger pacificus]|uniref:ABC transporter substrate-binding protein n=1 Tax=Salipiger mangrovisoli TaxID=2865933 RepID=A0ABR9X4S4_9RHOB|nr:ABC transporter substrate-binding protein [Salipiger mangrovisoli]MBE9638519.1 ABC transporter substrate-binding protein [Salipiger mangrovisoli]